MYGATVLLLIVRVLGFRAFRLDEDGAIVVATAFCCRTALLQSR